MANPRELALVVVIVTLFIGCAFSQSETMSFHGIVLGANGAIPLDQADVAPPVDTIGLAPPDATAEQLETTADELRARKAYLESMDYFRAALAKQPSAQLLNKMGIVELETFRLNDAKKSFERAIKLNKEQSDALNNLGVVYEEIRQGHQVLRGRYEYVMARLYAKIERTDESLQCLRKAIEAGYKDINMVYKDAEFSDLRKDPRFAQLMAAKPPVIPE